MCCLEFVLILLIYLLLKVKLFVDKRNSISKLMCTKDNWININN